MVRRALWGFGGGLGLNRLDRSGCRGLQAQTNESLILAETARPQLQAGNPDAACRVALRGLPNAGERPLVAETFGVLLECANELRPRHVLATDAGGFNSARFSPDGKYVVTASRDGSAQIWNAETGAKTATLTTESPKSLIDALYSPNGKYIIAASDDGTACLWDTHANKLIHSFIHGDKDLSGTFFAKFSNNGEMILTAGADDKARTWSTLSGKALAYFDGNQRNIHSADFSPDDKLVTTVSYDGHVRVWDPVTGKELSQIGGAHEGEDATFSPDGKLILIAGDHKSAFLSRTTGKGVGTAFKINAEVVSGDGGRGPASIFSAEFSRDGKRILTVSDDGMARIWTASDQMLRAILGGSFDQSWPGVPGQSDEGGEASADENLRALFRGDGLSALTYGSGSANLWDAFSGKQLYEFNYRGERVAFAQFSNDGTQILTTVDSKLSDGSTHDAAVIWTRPLGNERAAVTEDRSGAGEIDFSADGKVLIADTSTKEKKNTLWIFDASSDRQILTIDHKYMFIRNQSGSRVSVVGINGKLYLN